MFRRSHLFKVILRENQQRRSMWEAKLYKEKYKEKMSKSYCQRGSFLIYSCREERKLHKKGELGAKQKYQRLSKYIYIKKGISIHYQHDILIYAF